MNAPADATAARRHRVAPYVLGLLTLVLTFELAFQSSELHRVDLALREHQELLRERPQDKLYQAWKKLNIEGVYTAPPSTPASMDDYQKLADGARELADRRGAIVKLLVDASDLHLWPPSTQTDVPAVREIQPLGALPDCRRGGASRTPIEPVGGVPNGDPFTRERECFLASLRIAAGDIDYPLWSHAYAARDKVNLLVAWLLPGLYGLLGACVALMRAELDANAAARGPALAAVKLLYRLALGGLAGIIVGWFWSPGASAVAAGSAAATAPTAVPPLAFGVAFLAGFSIERLFDALDGLMDKIGARPPGAPAT